ncbi:proteasome activator complex subunit 3-like isoform X2 [Leptotrombidium deliense]|uniref:Proteasome activator complex subunit 3-like isoform X2 n=1 Tax=Leptotrombidium deliense TaxID=299467 RepID=A0A443S6P9_9ACAR|nr:proteasome activator complex subunit 3-like isoform X2 [Leptotrombidium deliense]
MIEIGECVVFKKIPKKVLELNELMRSQLFSGSLKEYELNIPIPDVTSDEKLQFTPAKSSKDNSPVLFPCGAVSHHEQISAMLEIVKYKVREMLNDICALRTWISLMTPRIEDGNNFGVYVQESVFGEISNVEDFFKSYRVSFIDYYTERGELIAKINRYPHSEDMRKALREVDEAMHYKCKMLLKELRDSYAILHDMICKNLKKVQSPRSSSNIHY